MPRLVHQNPSYRRHRSSGQAVVTISGKDVYLGPHGTKASREQYDRVIGEWLANGRRLVADTADLSVTELIEAYWNHAKSYYDSENAGEIGSIRLALRVLRRSHGPALVSDFGPLAFKAVRQQMIALNWARTYVNAQCGRLRRMFKWGVENELVPAATLHALQAVAGLKRGRTDAPESQPVRPVADADINAVKPYVSRQVWAIIELQRVTGMRPAEACLMRSVDVDTTGRLWVYRPSRHKTEHHGHERAIYLGPRARAIVEPFLKTNPQSFLFSPANAEAERHAESHRQRKTPLNCGNTPGSNRRRRPARRPGARYSVASYRRAIARACEIAFDMPAEICEPRTKKELQAEKILANDVRIARQKQRKAARAAWREQHCWHPHQLRHTAATRLRKQYGLEAAQVILGHKTLAVTEIYAEKNVEAARRIMAEAG